MTNAAGNAKSAEFRTYVVLALAVSVLFIFVFPMPLARLDVPFDFAGDTPDKLVQIKNVAETGWLFFNDRLGYPFAYDRLDFPRFDSLNYAIMGPIAAVTGEAGLAMNLYYLASFYLIAFSAFWTLRRLKIDVGPAVICALVFAFLPYHLFRGVTHLTNGAYFLVPPAILVLFWIVRDQIGLQAEEARKKLILSVAVAVLITLQTPYNGVFFSVLCAVASVAALVRHWKMRNIVVTGMLLATTAGTFVAEQVPRLIHQSQNGKVDTGERSPFEVQYYSTNLTQIILPTENHRLAPVRERVRVFNERMNVPNSEVRHQYIGVLGLIGLCALFICLSRRTAAVPQGERHFALEETVAIAGLLAIALLLFSISTGAGTILSYYFAQSIRALNRTLPFFAFFCLIGSAWALQVMLSRLKIAWMSRLACVLLGAVLLFDVVPRGMTQEERASTISTYDRMKNYFTEVENSLGPGAALFQMPVTWYPEHPPVNRMADYDNLKPFLLTDTLRFSAGVSRNRAGYIWGKFVERQPAAELIARTHAAGFDALLIDGFGYTEDELTSLVEGLRRVLPAEPFTSDDGRWWTFSLTGCCGEDVPQLMHGEQLDIHRYEMGTPVRFSSDGVGDLYRTNGWHDPESWGTWAGREAALRFRLEPSTSGPLVVSM